MHLNLNSVAMSILQTKEINVNQLTTSQTIDTDTPTQFVSVDIEIEDDTPAVSKEAEDQLKKRTRMEQTPDVSLMSKTTKWFQDFGIPIKVKTSFDKLSPQATKLLDDVSKEIGDITKSVKTLLARAQSSLDSISTLAMLERIVGIIIGIIAIWRTQDLTTQLCIAGSIALSNGLISSIYAHAIVKRLTTLGPVMKTQGLTELSHPEESENLISTFVTLIGHTFGVGKYDAKVDEKRAKKLGALGTAIRTMHDLVGYIVQGIKYAYKTIWEMVYGVPYEYRGLDHIMEKIRYIIGEANVIRQIKNLPEHKNKRHDTDYFHKILKLVADTEEIDFVRATFRKARTHVDYRPYETARTEILLEFDQTQREMNSLCKRKRPTVVCFIGPPDVGKSGLRAFVGMDFAFRHRKLQNTPKDQVIFEQVTDKFWDSYNNQLVYSIDDFGQIDDKTLTGPKCDEFIRLINDTAFPLMMSKIEEKNIKFFTSEFVVMTINQFPTDSNLGIREPDAFYRRFDFMVRAQLKQGIVLNEDVEPSVDVYDLFLIPKNDYLKTSVRKFTGGVPITLDELEKLIFELDTKRQNPKRNLLETAFQRAIADTQTNNNVVDDLIKLPPLIHVQGKAVLAKYCLKMGFCPFCDLNENLYLNPIVKNSQFVTTVSGCRIAICDECIVRLISFKTEYDHLPYDIYCIHQGWEPVIYSDPEDLVTSGKSKRHEIKGGEQAVKEAVEIWYKYHCAQELVDYHTLVVSSPITPRAQMKAIRNYFSKPDPAYVGLDDELTMPDIKDALKPIEQMCWTVEIVSALLALGAVVACVLTLYAGYKLVTRIASPHTEGKYENTIPKKGQKKEPVAMPSAKLVAKVQGDKQALDVANLFRKNKVRLSIIMNNGDAYYIEGHGIYDNVVVTAGHFIKKLSRPNAKFVSVEWQGTTQTCTVDEVDYERFEGRDLCFLNFPTLKFQFKSVYHHFIDSTDDISNALTSPVGYITENEIQYAEQTNYFGRVVYDDDDKEEVSAKNILEILSDAIHTEDGDCGNIYIMVNPRSVRKVLGIHVAGGGGFTYCQLVTQSDIQALPWKPHNLVARLKEQGKKVNNATIAVVNAGNLKPAIAIPDGLDVRKILEIKYAIRVPSKTEIVSTLIGTNCPIIEPIRHPAKLTKFTNAEGIEISPAELALKKMVAPDKKYDPFMKNLVKACMKIALDVPQRVTAKALEINDALNVPVGYRRVKSVDTRTSPGYPHNTPSEHCDHKHDFIDEDANGRRTAKSKLIDAVASLAESLMQENWDDVVTAIEKLIIASDCLKDELRLNEKVEAGKTRLFSSLPVEVLALMRMLFLDLIENAMRANNKTHFGLGINPESADWDKLFNDMFPDEYAKNHVGAGDITTQDAYTPSDASAIYAECLMEHYEANDPDIDIELLPGKSYSKVQRQRIRKALLFGVFQGCMHVFFNIMYKAVHGNPSGNLLTTHSNCCHTYCACLVSAVMFLHKRDTKWYSPRFVAKHIRVKTFGDDHIISWTKFLEGFGMGALVKGFEAYGYLLTDFKKRPIVVNETDWSATINTYNCFEVEFLKRTFIQNEFQQVSAPMQKEHCEDIANWTTNRLPLREGTRESAKQSLESIFHLGPHIYEEHQFKINERLSSFGIAPILKTWDERDAELTAWNSGYKRTTAKTQGKTHTQGKYDDCYLEDLDSQPAPPVPELIFDEHYLYSLVEEDFTPTQVVEQLLSMYTFYGSQTIFADFISNVIARSVMRGSEAEELIHKLELVRKAFIDYVNDKTIKRTGMKAQGKYFKQKVQTEVESEELSDPEYEIDDEDLPPYSFQDIHYSSPYIRSITVTDIEDVTDYEGMPELWESTPYQQQQEAKRVAEIRSMQRIYIDFFMQDNITLAELDEHWANINAIESRAYNAEPAVRLKDVRTQACWKNRQPIKQQDEPVLTVETHRSEATPEGRTGRLSPTKTSQSSRDKDLEAKRLENRKTVERLLVPNNRRERAKEFIKKSAFTLFLFSIGLCIGWTAMFFLQHKDLTSLPRDELLWRNPIAYGVHYRPGMHAQMLSSYRGTGIDLVGDNDNPVAKEQTAKSKSGVVSGVFRALSGVAGAFSFVPVYGGIASAASAVFKAGQWIASYFGYDYPVNVSSVDPFLVRQTSGIASVCGLDSAEPIGCDPQNSVSTESKFFCEMGGPYQNFANYRLLPALVRVLSFDAATGLNGIITTIPVSPTFMSNNIDATTWTLTPVGTLASMFHYWRGGLKYKIQFTCSKFVSCRVRIEWYPDTSLSAYFFNDTSGDVISMIVDICGDTDVPFMIPYLQDKPYLPVVPPNFYSGAPSTWNGECNGMFIVRLLIPPTVSNSTFDTTVYYAIWQSGAEDFVCDRPTDLFYQFVYSPNPAFPMSKQEKTNNNNEVHKRKGVRTQGRATVRAEFATVFPSLVPCSVTLINKILHGETVQSFIDLFHRYTFCSFAQGGAGFDQTISGFDWTNLDQTNSQWVMFQNCFLFHRGNIRYKFMQFDNSDTTVVGVSNTYINEFGPLEYFPDLPDRAGSTFNVSKFRYTNEVDVPFYGMFPLICHQMPNENYEWPGARINTYELGTTIAHTFRCYIACGDTYSCGVPIPPGYIAFVGAKKLTGVKTQMKTSENAQTGFAHEERKVAEPSVQENNQLTSFRDTVGVKEALGAPITPIHQHSDPYADQGLGPLLSRPYLVDYFTWSGANTIGIMVKKISFPYVLFQIPNIDEKLNRFKFFRAGVHVEIRLNSTTFHAGKILIVWLPHWNTANTSNQLATDDMYAQSMLEGITLSACANETVSFDIPYVAPSAYLDLLTSTAPGDVNEGFFGTVKMYVLAPLVLTGNIATPTLTVTTWANFVNPEPAGPIPFAELGSLMKREKGCSVPQTKTSTSLKDKLALKD